MSDLFLDTSFDPTVQLKRIVNSENLCRSFVDTQRYFVYGLSSTSLTQLFLFFCLTNDNFAMKLVNYH